MGDISLEYLDPSEAAPAVSPAAPTTSPTTSPTRRKPKSKDPGAGRASVQRAAERTAARGDQCQAPGCWAPVKSWGNWCAIHATAFQRRGHPTATAVRGKELVSYRKAAREFIELHQNHPGISAGPAWIASQIEEGVRRAPSEKPPGRKTRASLYWHLAQLRKVETAVLLEHCLAVFLHRVHNPRRYPELSPSLRKEGPTSSSGRPWQGCSSGGRPAHGATQAVSATRKRSACRAGCGICWRNGSWSAATLAKASTGETETPDQ